MGVLSNKIQREQLKDGDHIYTWRRAFIYAHHGIYVGDGKVIHFTQSAAARREASKGNVFDAFVFSSAPSPFSGYCCPTCGDQSSLDGVIQSCLDCFLSGGDLCRYEYGVTLASFLTETGGSSCTLAFAGPCEEVLHRARYLLENGFGAYDLFKNNCIDFALYCKTSLIVDHRFSVRRVGQVTSLLAAARNFIATRGFTLVFLTTRCPYLAALSDGVYCVSKWLSDIGVRPDASRIAVEDLVKGGSELQLGEGKNKLSRDGPKPCA